MSRRFLPLFVFAALIAVCAGALHFRVALSYLVPIRHEGVVYRVAAFDKGGMSSRTEDTRQLRQFAIVFEDGYDCEGTDTSFAAVKVGDHIRIRGYYDVHGVPFIDPEWLECDEAQLDGIDTNVAP